MKQKKTFSQNCKFAANHLFARFLSNTFWEVVCYSKRLAENNKLKMNKNFKPGQESKRVKSHRVNILFYMSTASQNINFKTHRIKIQLNSQCARKGLGRYPNYM